MKTYGKLFLVGSCALLLLWGVPWLYNLITLEAYSTPFTLYSCTLHDFASLDRGEGKGFRFIDTKGNIHGDETQPMFYASVLASRGALPDSLEGRRVSLEEIERNAVIATSDPKDINRTLPPVYLLMESVPERLELKDPEDALVSRAGSIDIVEMATNQLREEKTALLNKALREQGFAYPARLFSGKPSHRKAYDEGYLVTDAQDKLYQLKQVNDTVTVRHFPEADGLGLKFVMITEFENHATLAYLVSAGNVLHILLPDGRTLSVRKNATVLVWNPPQEGLYTLTVTERGADGTVNDRAQIKIDVAKAGEMVYNEPVVLLSDTAGYVLTETDDKTLLRGVKPGTTAAALLGALGIEGGAEPELTVTLADGGTPGEEQALPTGARVTLTDWDKVYADWHVIVSGDVNGDGKVGIADFAKLRQHLLKGNVIAGDLEYAADLNGDGKIGVADFAKLRQHLLGKIELD